MEKVILQKEILEYVNSFHRLSETTFRRSIAELITVLSDEDLLKLYHMAPEYLMGLRKRVLEELIRRNLIVEM